MRLTLTWTTALLGAASAQILVLGARSMADALVGAAPVVDGVLAAAGLFGFAAGALLSVQAKTALTLLAIGALLFGGVITNGTAALAPVLRLAPEPRLVLVALALAAVAAPAGALVPALARRAPAPGVYAADLLGAALGALSASTLAALVGLAPLAFAAAALAVGAALVARSSAPAKGSTDVNVSETASTSAAFVAGAVVASAAVGVLEAELPRALAPATASSPDAFAFVLVGVLVAGALGAASSGRARVHVGLVLVVQALALAVLVACLPALRLLLVWLTTTDTSATTRTAMVGVVIAVAAAPLALCSGVVLAAAIRPARRTGGQHPLGDDRPSVRRTLAASSAAAGAAALGTATALSSTPPEHLLAGAAAFVLLAALVVCARASHAAALDTRTLARRPFVRRPLVVPFVAAPLVGALIVAASVRGPDMRFATFDLSRALLLGQRGPPLADATVLFDATDRSGRTVVAVDEDEVLYRDGKPDASELGDVDTQTFLAVLPLLFRPNAKSALVIGLGSGTTARMLAQAGVARVDVIELSPAVIAAFAGRLPAGVRVVSGDARAYLAGTDARYDVITSEPSNLFVSGMPRLVTREAFAAMASALQPGGVLVAWMHGYHASPELLRMVARTALGVFGNVEVFAGRTSDLFFTASAAPLRSDAAGLDARFALVDAQGARRGDPSIASCALAALGHASLRDVLRRRTLVDAGAGPLNEDAHPRAVLLARRALLDATVLAAPAFMPPSSRAEALMSLGAARDVDGQTLATALRARAAEGSLAAREVLVLLKSEVGRALALAHAADVRLAPDARDAPWMFPLARAALALTLGNNTDVDAMVEALEALGRPGCATSSDWDVALGVAGETARRASAIAADGAVARIARALTTGPAQAKARSRRLLAQSLAP